MYFDVFHRFIITVRVCGLDEYCIVTLRIPGFCLRREVRRVHCSDVIVH